MQWQLPLVPKVKSVGATSSGCPVCVGHSKVSLARDSFVALCSLTLWISFFSMGCLPFHSLSVCLYT